MSSYRDYDSFADIYNRHWGGFGVSVVEPLDRLGLAELDPGDRILDLCCGTGQLAAVLGDRGLAVVGVDASAPMIAYARANAPKAEFLVADARDFSLAEPVRMAVSTFDSLNHLMSLEDLTAVFRRVAAALERGGRFVFDLNMAVGYRARWHGHFVIDEPGEYLIAASSWDEATSTGEMAFVWFSADGDLWRRGEAVLTQRCYQEDEVEAALIEAGFGDMTAADAAQVMEGWQEGRTFFAATRR